MLDNILELDICYRRECIELSAPWRSVPVRTGKGKQKKCKYLKVTRFHFRVPKVAVLSQDTDAGRQVFSADEWGWL